MAQHGWKKGGKRIVDVKGYCPILGMSGISAAFLDGVS